MIPYFIASAASFSLLPLHCRHAMHTAFIMYRKRGMKGNHFGQNAVRHKCTGWSVYEVQFVEEGCQSFEWRSRGPNCMSGPLLFLIFRSHKVQHGKLFLPYSSEKSPLVRSASVIPSKYSFVKAKNLLHIGSVLQLSFRLQGTAPQARQATGASAPSVRRRISPTVYSAGFRQRRYPPPFPCMPSTS